MQRTTNHTLLYSPSDLIKFVENEAIPWFDRFDIEHPCRLARDEIGEHEEMLSHAGDQHELEFVRTLEVAGSNVANLKDRDFASTLQAMQLGLEVIYQARLEGDEFAGYADFLSARRGSLQLGPYEYEVWDTKLARSPKPYFVIQLCCYAEMIESIQGCLPTQHRRCAWQCTARAISHCRLHLLLPRREACIHRPTVSL